MRMKTLLALAIIATLCLPAAAQIGSPLPAADLEGFTQTEARSLDDYVGRALLIEFFAYT